MAANVILKENEERTPDTWTHFVVKNRYGPWIWEVMRHFDIDVKNCLGEGNEYLFLDARALTALPVIIEGFL